MTAEMLHHDRVAEHCGMRVEVRLRESRAAPNARSPAVEPRSAPKTARAYFLPRVSPPKRLLKRATWPPVSSSLRLPPVHAGCDLRIDVEVQRVAFLAPGRTGLELGAVGHFDVDHVIIGVGIGLHLDFPWLSRWFPTSGDKLSGASTRQRAESCNFRRAAAALPCAARAARARQARSRRTASPA